MPLDIVLGIYIGHEAHFCISPNILFSIFYICIRCMYMDQLRFISVGN